MKTLIDYIRLCLFVGTAFIGVQIPSFVEQYGQRLQSHALESELSLKEFQADAERFFKGDIEQLIEHYTSSDDSVFIQGGESISVIYQRNTLLEQSLTHFNTSAFSPYQATFVSPITDIRDEAWRHYDHSIRLNEASIIWALGLGFIFTSICELLLSLLLKILALTTTKMFSSKKTTRSHRVTKKAPPTI